MVVLMLGNFCERKGHFDAVEAAGIVRNAPPAAIFLFYVSERDPGVLSQLHLLVRAKGLEDTVRFVAPVFGSEKLEQLAKATVFILPSHTENMPIAVMEAMAAGLPVVATRVGAIPEMIEDGRTGVLVEPRSPDELARVLIDLLGNVDKQRSLGMRAAETARSRWDRELIGKQTAELYDSLVQEL